MTIAKPHLDRVRQLAKPPCMSSIVPQVSTVFTSIEKTEAQGGGLRSPGLAREVRPWQTGLFVYYFITSTRAPSKVGRAPILQLRPARLGLGGPHLALAWTSTAPWGPTLCASFLGKTSSFPFPGFFLVELRSYTSPLAWRVLVSSWKRVTVTGSVPQGGCDGSARGA